METSFVFRLARASAKYCQQLKAVSGGISFFDAIYKTVYVYNKRGGLADE